MRTRKPYTPLLMAMLTLASNCAMAKEVDIGLRAGGTYDDNVARTESAEEDQIIAIVGLNLDVEGESRKFEGKISADVEFRDYLDDAFEDELFPNVEANANFKLAPDIFEWIIEDKFGVIRRNQLSADTPDNRENINTLSTGPNLTLRLGDRYSAGIQARYRDTWFELGDFGNTVLSGNVSLSRALTPSRSISLNASTDRVEYDNTDVNSNFDRQSAYLGFNSRVSRGSLIMNIGVNELHDGGEKASGTFASVSFNRNLSDISAISIAYSKRFSDSGDIFRTFSNFGTLPGDTQDIVPSGDAFESQHASFAYNYNKGARRWSLSVYATDDDYGQEGLLGNQRVGSQISLSQEFSSGWELTGYAKYEEAKFDAQDRTDEYLDFRATITKRLSRTFSLDFVYQRLDRTSDAAGQNFVDNRYTLMIRFHPKFND